MAERPAGASGADLPAAAAFPGATGVTVLDVYDWPARDGLPGGSAHVHLASTEGYVVLAGAGRAAAREPGGRGVPRAARAGDGARPGSGDSQRRTPSGVCLRQE
jgi:hypothetical protein